MGCCEGTPGRELLRAIEEFNRHDWFECHETLEELWKEEKGEMRDFYQGILLVAAGFLHWRKGNFNGAVSVLKRGSGYLRRVRPDCRGVDVSGLISDTGTALDALTALGPSRMGKPAPRLIPVLRNAPEPAGEE